MSEGFEHPAHREAERLMQQAEQARRESNQRASNVLERAAALREATAARETHDALARSLLWSSAVAFALHSDDRELLAKLAIEALATGIDERAAREIREMLAPEEPSRRPSILTRRDRFVAKLAA